jgi:hypothetical protein
VCSSDLGYYNVRITNAAGCSAVSENVFFELPLSVLDFENDVVALYPNPSNGVFTIQLQHKEKFSVSIFDMQGRKIIAQDFIINEATFQLQNLPKGVYQLQLSQKNKLYIRKLILY